jgi:hypothetical protein
MLSGVVHKHRGSSRIDEIPESGDFRRLFVARQGQARAFLEQPGLETLTQVEALTDLVMAQVGFTPRSTSAAI